MSKPLYLDTARLGLMTLRARRASVDFARFASELGCSLYSKDFLQDGFDCWPDKLKALYPGLSHWDGVPTLKARLRRVAEARPDSEVLVSSRSATLMKMAARLQFRVCRNVLITDLTWPSYERHLRVEQRNASATVTKTLLRRRLYRQKLTIPEVVEHIANAYLSQQCDGLFLPLVDSYGVHLPVQRIVERIRRDSELRFVVVDGAQAINHVPLSLANDYCDFLVAGCHKWLRGATPMGVGFYGNPRTRGGIQKAVDGWITNGTTGDPLLGFSQELITGRGNRFGETVAVSPLITANAAVVDVAPPDSQSVASNSQLIRDIGRQYGWTAVEPGTEFQDRILLMRAPEHELSAGSPDALRRHLQDHDVIASTYRRRLVRFSLPSAQITQRGMHQLHDAFAI